ncbi:class I SAM-dependent DNA methyltransferase [Flavobacterium sp.]|uniref:type I restriction-modification system subunit M n=1 Tax=Flavobacterium sp. TaxID=239 RepID=UPI00248A3CB8|nr:class I SAM-dependent DNA methyltransferase [Flavobacterium sp.]MDI1317901.1 class I SAM-dependent DNA methyltransferase [Flavobacterium sp.]
MTAEQLKQLESRLWKTADDLRANSKLTASEYSFPVLGLIFLRQAFNRYVNAKIEIEKHLPVHPVRGVRPIEKNDFLTAKAIFLPENSQWNTIANLPDSADLGEYINEAMRGIESEYEALVGVLPKDYNLFDKDLLQRLIRVFNDESLNDVTGDVFGRIYEFFLNKFAMIGAQEGGEFFTPPSLVNTIVKIIEPNHGIVADIAVGSAGMFVQTAHFIEDEEGVDPSNKVTFYGQEKADTNTRLAKMNMAIHGLEGSILQGNTFYEDKHELLGRCDYIMANPPFNVDGIDKSKDSVKKDKRLPFGLPKNDNGNYLWIQYFYSLLNETGRAGFVMASSASDAGHSEKDIRQKLVETGAVDVMVSIGTKFFYTRSLPCTLWFFDRSKEKDSVRANKTLMLDLRDVYRKVSSNLHDFTPEQLNNIQAIVGLYRGKREVFDKTMVHYFETINEHLTELTAKAQNLADDYTNGLKPTFENSLPKEWIAKWKETIDQDDIAFTEQVADELAKTRLVYNNTKPLATLDKAFTDHLKKAKRGYNNFLKAINAFVKEAGKEDDLRKNKDWKTDVLDKLKQMELDFVQYSHAIDQILYFNKEAHWLISRFPNSEYADVAGLCKVVDKTEIANNDFSLTAGRYVGVAPQIDEDFDYEERMAEIKVELLSLNEEAVGLAEQIQLNLTELGL